MDTPSVGTPYTGTSEFLSSPGSITLPGSLLEDSHDSTHLFEGTYGFNYPPLQVEPKDLRQVEGDRLYCLNPYSGLLVFEISNIDY